MLTVTINQLLHQLIKFNILLALFLE
jgi:hypothetical protein